MHIYTFTYITYITYIYMLLGYSGLSTLFHSCGVSLSAESAKNVCWL